MKDWSHSESLLLRRAARLLRGSEVVGRLLSVVNYLVFLGDGRFPSLMFRVAGLETLPASDDSPVSACSPAQLFLQSRRLLWQALIVCLLR